MSPTANSGSGGLDYDRHAYRNMRFYHTGWPAFAARGQRPVPSAFPAPLEPVDDRPPFTVITRVDRVGADRLLVRGVSVDDGAVRCVRVNGRPVRPLAGDFSRWEVEIDLSDAPGGSGSGDHQSPRPWTMPATSSRSRIGSLVMGALARWSPPLRR